MKHIFYCTALLISVLSCAKEPEIPAFEETTGKTFTVYSAPFVESDTGKEQERIWPSGSTLTVLSSEDRGTAEIFSMVSSSGQSARFDGTVTKGKKYYALYPSDESASMDGEILTTSIPPVQSVSEGLAGMQTSPAVAVSGGTTLSFSNIASVISFTLPESVSADRAVIQGLSAEKLGGAVSVDMGRDVKSAERTSASVEAVTLEGDMQPGKTYSFSVIPVSFQNGFSISLYRGESLVHTMESRARLLTGPGKIYLFTEADAPSPDDIELVDGKYHIYTSEGMAVFSDIVNNDDPAADAVLENDIDMSGITEWTPIGQASVSYSKSGNRIYVATISGSPYSGEFDGNGKTLSGLRLSVSGAEAGRAYGLFGVLDNASVKNLTLGKPGDGSFLEIVTSGPEMQDIGVLAGCCHESSVADVTSHVSVSYKGTSSGRVTIGVIGMVHSDTRQSVLERVVNRGDYNISTDANQTNVWATAIHAGGVCGAALSAYDAEDKPSNRITFLSYCENYGNMTSNAGRTAGIAAAAPYYVVFNSCFNHGAIHTSNSAGGYASGITVFSSYMTMFQDCINNGNVVSASGAGVSGLISMCAYNYSTVSACMNFGKIISDSPKRGVFVATNSATSQWIGCTAAGKTGCYNSGNYVYDTYQESEQFRYLGPGADKLRLDGTVFQIGESELPPGPEPTLKILFIGNSFTQDAVNLLPGIIQGAGIGTIELGLMYWGGSIIQQHYDEYSTNNTNFVFYRKPTSVNGTWLQYRGYTLEEAVKEHDWDIITIQEHTGRTESWIWDAQEKNAIEGLVGKILESQSPAVPEIYYIMTQAYHDMDKSYDTRGRFASDTEHFSYIVAQGKKIRDEISSISGIIPTGTVLQNLRTSSMDNPMGLTRDGYHMDYGFSRYAAACAVYEMLIMEHSGHRLEDNSFRYSETGTGKTPVTDENRIIAIGAARAAIEKPFEVTEINR